MGTEADRRRELARAYKEHPRPAGVYRITNTATGKMLLGSSLNAQGALNGHRFMLSHGAHRNAALQQDWIVHGAAAFAFEILDVVPVRDDPAFDLAAELEVLEVLWMEELWGSGDRGYNESARLRQA